MPYTSIRNTFRFKPVAFFLVASLFLFCFSCEQPKNGSNDSEKKIDADFVATMWNTYYHLVQQDDYPVGDEYTLYDIECKPLTDVSEKFFVDLCDEGAGILSDGRTINNDSTCECAPECPLGYTVCYTVLDPETYPWGVGAMDNPVTPLVSWAVDNNLIEFQTVLYSPQWDGLIMPKVDGLGGFVHDGCFSADDHDIIGGRVTDNHYDFYTGTRDMWLALENVLPTYTNVSVYKNYAPCDYLLN